MKAGLSHWYAALSRREQALVGVAAAFTAITLIAWTVIGLGNAIDVRRDSLAEATERRVRIEAKAKALSGASAQIEKAAPTSIQQGSLDLAISQSAAEKGFTLDKTEAHGEDQLAIIIAQARPVALLGWLSELEAQSVIVDEISIKPGTNGTVAVTATLKRQTR